MKAIKIAVVALLAYAGLVTAFESLIGFMQPTPDSTIVITTLDEAGAPHDRVVTRLVSDGQIYVAANHWPRAWYHRALQNPHVQVAIDGVKGDFIAVPVTGAEHDRVESEHPHSFGFRFMTGFPPRYFVRLDPAAPVK
ncbi:MAG TPA: nitroreductase/quinone reductase family protein [Myxococcota bacterium]|nr:nitroreductase/quinone reductase family protein [Myxococcota bacterium]